jgi:TfoX/Sxy family transcriptional regulator of competence genes
MAYDVELADRVRELVAQEKGLTEQPMFGGLGMLVNGNMAVAVRGRTGGLLVRVEPDKVRTVLAEPGADEMTMRGKAMPGWITVDPAACRTPADLKRWVARGVQFARTLPPK